MYNTQTLHDLLNKCYSILTKNQREKLSNIILSTRFDGELEL